MERKWCWKGSTWWKMRAKERREAEAKKRGKFGYHEWERKAMRRKDRSQAGRERQRGMK